MIRLIVLLTLAPIVLSQEPGKSPDPKPAEKKTEGKKDEPKKEEEVDVQKTTERIAENAQKAGDRLKDKDPGVETRKIQDEIIKDIDALLKKAQNPPPPPQNSDMSPMMPPPMGGGGMGQPMPKGGMPPPKGGMGGMPMGGGSQDPGRRSRRERKERGDRPMGGMNPMPMGGGMQPMPGRPDPKEGQPGMPMNDGQPDKFGKASPKRQNDKLADLYKDVWGHLPDRLRQEMDLYYREQFMPRYSELLKRYYSALAEQKKKGDDR